MKGQSAADNLELPGGEAPGASSRGNRAPEQAHAADREPPAGAESAAAAQAQDGEGAPAAQEAAAPLPSEAAQAAGGAPETEQPPASFPAPEAVKEKAAGGHAERGQPQQAETHPGQAGEPAAQEPQPAARLDSGEAKAQRGLPSAREGPPPAAGSQMAKPAAASANPAAEPEPVKAGGQRPHDPEDADDVMTRRVPGAEAGDAAVLAASGRHTRRSFVGALAGAAAGYGVYAYLNHAPDAAMQPSPIRNALNGNAWLNRELFRYRPLAPTYPLYRAENLRINGIFGLKKELELAAWRLQVVGARDAARSPRYTADVTAWEYRYGGQTAGLGENHDTKEAPKPGDAAPPEQAPGRAQQGAAAAGPPGGSSVGESAQGSKAQPSGGKGRRGGPMPAVASSTRMAPAPMLAKAMADEMPDDDDEHGEDDNHLGRKPRGQEESGESDSTLRAGTPGLLLTLADITKLPRRELVTQFKCIEGWSQIVHWAGVRMADFLDAYPPELINGREPAYVYMETPNGDYYTGYRLRELRHPQALLVTEMMGAPLTQLHGAPLRLHMPNKYGYKQIKRIGLIAYTDDKPDDYWTKLGYDWYADL